MHYALCACPDARLARRFSNQCAVPTANDVWILVGARSMPGIGWLDGGSPRDRGVVGVFGLASLRLCLRLAGQRRRNLPIGGAGAGDVAGGCGTGTGVRGDGDLLWSELDGVTGSGMANCSDETCGIRFRIQITSRRVLFLTVPRRTAAFLVQIKRQTCGHCNCNKHLL